MVALPFCIGVLYMTTPDPILGGLDDALVMGVMSWITFLQWHKKAPGVSWWVIVPLMGVAVYELVGGLIPGPLDEMIVAAFGTGIAVILGTNIHQAENFMALSVNDVNGENNQGIIIEGKNDKGLKTNTKEVIEQTFEP
jgi:hypothetical protein